MEQYHIDRVKEIQGMKGLSQKQKYYLYLKTSHWRKLRRAKLVEAKKQCSICSSKERIEVHHLNYNQWHDVQLSDLQVVCQKCHSKHHK